MAYNFPIKVVEFNYVLIALILLLAINIIIIYWHIYKKYIHNCIFYPLLISLIIMISAFYLGYSYAYINKEIKPNLYRDSYLQDSFNNNELMGMYFREIGYEYKSKNDLVHRNYVKLKAIDKAKDYKIIYYLDNCNTKHEFLITNNSMTNINNYNGYKIEHNPMNYNLELALDMTFDESKQKQKIVDIEIYNLNNKLLSTMSITFTPTTVSIEKAIDDNKSITN